MSEKLPAIGSLVRLYDSPSDKTNYRLRDVKYQACPNSIMEIGFQVQNSTVWYFLSQRGVLWDHFDDDQVTPEHEHIKTDGTKWIELVAGSPTTIPIFALPVPDGVILAISNDAILLPLTTLKGSPKIGYHLETTNPPNSIVSELRLQSSPTEFGTMLRLASEMELLKDSNLENLGHTDLWAYLQTKGFEPTFVENIAKVYWKKACNFINQIPYHNVVTEAGCTSQRRLMSYLLRQVCHTMAQETSKHKISEV